MRDRMRMESESEARSCGGFARAAVKAVAVAIVLSALAGGRFAMSAGRGTQGYLGVDIRDVSDDQISVLKLKEARGAEVVRVDHDGPAGKVGLREHDVILQMNGETVQGQEQLRRMLHETPAGRAVTLVISRDGQQQTLNTQLANREEVERLAWQQHFTVPEPSGFQDPQSGDATANVPGGPGGKAGNGDAAVPPTPGGLGFFRGGIIGGRSHSLIGPMMGAPYTGAVVEPVGAQLADFFGVKDGVGLLVRSVDGNSPAATAGLRAGDVVVKANQTALANPGDWARTMHENRGKAVSLTVMREKKEQTLSLTPDTKRRSAMQWPDGPGFADVAGPDSDRMVASLAPLAELDLRKMVEDAKRANLVDKDQIAKMLQDTRKQSVLHPDQIATMLEDANRQSDAASQLWKSLDLGKDELRLSVPNVQLQMDEMLLDLPGRMD